MQRDHNLFNILTGNKNKLYDSIRKSKSDKTSIEYLDVNGTRFKGDKVADGFYESFKQLKYLN